MALFDGVEFGERGGGGGAGFQGRGRRAEVTTVAIPSGGVVLMRGHGGEGISAFSIACQGDEAALIALRGRVGSSGSLDFAGGIFTVRVQAISGVEQVIDGVDLWRWSLEVLA